MTTQSQSAEHRATLETIVQLIGNVDHSLRNSYYSALTRGNLLNDIRALATAALEYEGDAK